MEASPASGPVSRPTPRRSVRVPPRLVRTVAAAVVVLNAFVATVVGLNLRRSWAQRQEQAALSAQSTARLLERSLAAVFDRADQALLAVVDEHIHQLASGRPDPAGLGAVRRSSTSTRSWRPRAPRSSASSARTSSSCSSRARSFVRCGSTRASSTRCW